MSQLDEMKAEIDRLKKENGMIKQDVMGWKQIHQELRETRDKEKEYWMQKVDEAERRFQDLQYITIERLEGMNAQLKAYKAFYDYWTGLYGQNLQVANWHGNGDLEAFDDFYECAQADLDEIITSSEEEAL